MTHKIKAFAEGLISYDYMLFGGVFVLFLLFIILSILLRKKLFLALIFVFVAFGVLILGPTWGYVELHKYLFKNSVKLISQKRLTYSEAIVVKGSVTNESKFDFKSCKITATAFRVSTNRYKNYLLALKPLKKTTITTAALAKGQTQEFKLFIEPFRYAKDYNVTLKGECQ